jgi:molybdenum cofactor cytidylyltransferase
VATLIAVFSATGAPVVRARFQGRNGHPVVFSRAVFDHLRAADPQVGAKAILRAHAGAIVEVDVEDPAVVGDVDTPEDYRRLLDRR